jgi:predicted RNA-binding Zn ribbon-like protein
VIAITMVTPPTNSSTASDVFGEVATSKVWQSLYEEEPGERAPAPGELRLLQLFLNSVDIEAGTDGFATVSGFRSWLLGCGLIRRNVPVSEPDRALGARTREAIRDLAGANTGHAVGARSVDLLNRLGGSGLTIQFDRTGAARLAGSNRNILGALATMLSVIPVSMAAGTWPRLKVCRRDKCRWVFYDRSKPGRGVWCTMSICGARTKSAAYYRRASVRGSEFV